MMVSAESFIVSHHNCGMLAMRSVNSVREHGGGKLRFGSIRLTSSQEINLPVVWLMRCATCVSPAAANVFERS